MAAMSPYTEELRKYVFATKTLDKPIIEKLFNEMDIQIWNIIKFLIRNTDLVQPHIAEIYYSFLIGNDHNKSTFLIDLDAPKLEHPIFKNSQKSEFITRTSDLLFSTTREDYIIQLEKAQFLRSVFEEIIEHFLQKSEEYLQLDLNYTKIHNRLIEGRELRFNNLKFVANHLQKIEEVLGVNRLSLYFIFNKVGYYYKKYNKARQDIIDSFLRIVFSEAQSKTSEHVSLEDNFQNGYFGLLKASKTYDQRKKVPFGIFAKHWIKQTILKQMPVEGNTIYIPNIVHQKANKEKEEGSTSNHFIKITNSVITYSLDEVNKDNPDSLPLHNTIKDQNNSILNFEYSHFNNTFISEISSYWTQEEKTIVFLHEGMIENLPKKEDIPIKGKLLEVVHQLFKAESFSDL